MEFGRRVCLLVELGDEDEEEEEKEEEEERGRQTRKRRVGEMVNGEWMGDGVDE